MKKFFFNAPLQPKGQLKLTRYQSFAGNPKPEKLQLEHDVSFPILAAINGYVSPEEDYRVIAVVQDRIADKEYPAGEDARSNAQRNCDTFVEQLGELCEMKGLRFPKNGVERIAKPANQSIACHIATFQKLLDYIEDDDELFACITYGTKSMPLALLNAIHYGYKLKKNTSISCIVYGERDYDSVPAIDKIYDVTALVQLDEITAMLAEDRIENPKAVMDMILGL